MPPVHRDEALPEGYWSRFLAWPPSISRKRQTRPMSEPGDTSSGSNDPQSTAPQDAAATDPNPGQVHFRSDTSSQRLPPDTNPVASFQGLKVAPNDEVYSQKSDSSYWANNVAAANVLAKLSGESDEVVVQSLKTLSNLVHSLTEADVLQAWNSAPELLSTASSQIVRGTAYDFYISLCVRYQNNPMVISKWIKTFGDPNDPADKDKLSIFSLIGDDQHNHEASLMHLLTTLLVTWHKKAETVRQQQQPEHGRRNSKRGKDSGDRPIPIHEEEKLQELFDYCKAYITIQPQAFSSNDSTVVAESISLICKTATIRKPIDNCLDVIDLFRPKSNFSLGDLQTLLEVICTIIAQIRGLAPRSHDLILTLANSRYQLQVSEALTSYLNNIKSVTIARRTDSTIAQGAVMAIAKLFESTEKRDPAFLGLAEVLGSCSSACGKGHAKLEMQILALLAQILRSSNLSELQGRCWSSIITILKASIRDIADFNTHENIYRLTDKQNVYKLLDKLLKHEKVEAPKKEDRTYPDYLSADKLNTLVKINDFIESRLDTLTPEQIETFFDYFMSLEIRLEAYSSKLLVRYFLRNLNTNARRTSLIYDKLIEIASLDIVHPESRLDCLRLLFRLRCDSADHMWVEADPDCEYTASALNKARRRSNIAAESNEHIANDSSEDSSSPSWMYPESKGLPEQAPTEPSDLVFSARRDETTTLPPNVEVLDLKRWLEVVIGILTTKNDWDAYTYTVVHLGNQLSNMQLFKTAEASIKFLKNKISEITYYASYMEPPTESGLKKANIAICVYSILTVLIPYRIFSKDEQDQMVSCFVRGLSSLEGTTQCCIHALSICCLEMPTAFDKFLGQILSEMQRVITQPQLSVHVLEFLSSFARNPQLRMGIQKDEVKSIFGICITYLNIARDAKARGLETPNRLSSPPSRRSLSGKSDDQLSTDRGDAAKDFPEYVFALTFHTMNFWFLSLKMQDRVDHVGWLIKRLVFKDGARQYIEEQAQVFVDMMQRTTFSDLGETQYDADFADENDGSVTKKSWLIGHSVVTIETAGKTGRSQITKRQASGTTHATYFQHTAEIPAHHIPIQADPIEGVSGSITQAAMMPSHILLQQISTAAGIPSNAQPTLLPETPATERALRAFDAYNTVDSHGIGLIYIGPGQTHETDILANTTSSSDFEQFLETIGTKVPLEGAKFNTHGLNAATDGEYTYAWRDRLTEIVFHIPSMMPTNLETDPQSNNKKRTIGNDFVKIMFDQSNQPFDFNTFPSAFNHVNIVITPADRLSTSSNGDTAAGPTDLSTSFYKVQCLTNHDMPDISPAPEPKLMCGRNLALFVRQTALNAALFALVWQHGEQSAQYTSRWRNRLQEIKRLRARVVNDINKQADEAAAESAAPAYYQATSVFGGGSRISRSRGAGAPGERTSIYPEDRELAAVRPVTDLDAVLATGNLVDVLDFAKWSS